LESNKEEKGLYLTTSGWFPDFLIIKQVVDFQTSLLLSSTVLLSLGPYLDKESEFNTHSYSSFCRFLIGISWYRGPYLPYG